jgi:cytochrome P450
LQPLFLEHVAHNGLTKNQINLYQPILDKGRTTFLSHLYNYISEEKGMDPTYLLEHYTMSSILTIAFGDMCSFEPGDPVLREAFKITERAAQALSPSDQLREFFPILKKFWPVKRTRYLILRRDLLKFYGGLLEQFKEIMAKDSSNAPDCFVKVIMAQKELTDLQIAHFVSLFVNGGSETTTSTLRWMIAYLANHPEIQDKAYEEIKRVVGLDRLPGANDGK